MITLMCKIKKTSPHYKMGLNQKGRTIWLSILDFNPVGTKNFKIRAVKRIKNGFAEWQNIWVSHNEIIQKQHDDKQLTLDIFSEQEIEENKHNPRYFNQRRFEITTANEKQYVTAPDLETAHSIAKRYGLPDYSITQVPRLTKNEINN